MSDRDKCNEFIESLAARNIGAYFFESLNEAEDSLFSIIPEYATVGIGNSQTLKRMKLAGKLELRGNTVLDKTAAETGDESHRISREALLADWYVSSANAVSLDGHIVNIDHSGNRIAALTYGPTKVIIVIGVNKIEKTLEAAIARARNRAAVLNARRAGYSPPCVIQGYCSDCRSAERVCNYLLIIEGQAEHGRLKVFIVNDNLGF